LTTLAFFPFKDASINHGTVTSTFKCVDDETVRQLTQHKDILGKTLVEEDIGQSFLSSITG
jgi:hypothetical protein